MKFPKSIDSDDMRIFEKEAALAGLDVQVGVLPEDTNAVTVIGRRNRGRKGPARWSMRGYWIWYRCYEERAGGWELVDREGEAS